MTERDAAAKFWGKTVFDARESDENLDTSRFIDAPIETLMDHIIGINTVRDNDYDWTSIMGLDQREWWEGKRVLDFGCGTGCESYLISKNKPMCITVADIVESNIIFADRVLTHVGQRHDALLWKDVDGLRGELKCLKKYDIIYSPGVIHHIPDAKDVVSVLKKSLKPDGVFHLMLYYGNLKSLYHGNPAIGKDDKITTVVEGPYARTYTDKEVQNLVGPEFKIETKVVFNSDHFCLWIIGRK
jgi:2-polyprenyl-3-methyl-5-hydroxy-6-metoxy-1,4-benzoquinol methylase